MNKVKTILLWVFSIFMFLLGIVLIGNSVVSSLLMFASGIISNPLFLKKIHIKRIINIIACVVLFFAAIMFFPGGNEKPTQTFQLEELTTEETTTEETTEKESTKSKKDLEESKKESSIAASKKAAKESSVAASKKAAKESSVAASKKAVKESSIAASKKAAEESSIAASKAEEALAQSQAEVARQASIAQSQADAAYQASVAQSQADAAYQASVAQSQADAAYQASIAQSQAESQQAAQAQGPLVWITATGQKYHNKPDCGNSNPNTSRQVSLQEAQAWGYPPCKKCY